MAYETLSSRWLAVQSRDPAASNMFVYAVLTTRIYCRPTCPARLARRANVAFYDSASQAAAKGFRACKRCKPESGDGVPEDAAVKAVRDFVSRSEDGLPPGNLAMMAKDAGLSKWHFHRTFVKVVGVTPGEWFKRRNGEPLVNHEISVPIHHTEEVSHSPALSYSWSSCNGTTPATSEDSPENENLGMDFDLNFDMTEEDWAKFITFDGMDDLLVKKS